MILNYYLPEGSSIDTLLHERVGPILPFSIALGNVTFYKPVHSTDCFDTPFVDLYRSTVVVNPTPHNVSVIVSHKYARYDAPDKFTLGVAKTDAHGNFKYLAWSLPKVGLITAGLPDDPTDPHAPKLIAHELMHVFRGDTENAHCKNYIDARRCIMNPPAGQLSRSELRAIGLKLCNPCYDSARQARHL